MQGPKLSVCIITKNEEKDLPRCLESVKDLADEIIVVDSGSIDSTVSIAKRFGAKTFERKFDNYATQKNYSNDRASGDWILQLDADEVVTKDLAAEIEETIKQVPDHGRRSDIVSGYLIPRRNIILGGEIKHTRWSPDKHIWLWRKGKGKWVGTIHEEVEVIGKVQELKNAKIHYQYETVSEFFSMMNNYTEREAMQKVESGKRFSFVQLLYAPLLSFFRRFIYKQGFRDGWRGFVLSYLMAIYRMTTWIKVWERASR